ncbi:MAG: GNAT family protein [Saprospiraceae bacterium]|nr:GNAT family protein [Saprospiraceae bacterium]
MKPGEIIRVNQEIILTGITEEDLEVLVERINDPTIYANTLKVPYPYGHSDGKHFIRHVLDFESVHGMQKDWAIRRDNTLIGGIGLLYEQGLQSHRSEIGYWLATPYRNQGIMTAVIRAFVEAVFAGTDLVRLDAHVFVDNPASGRVLEKAGFQREGLLKKAYLKDGVYRDAFLYATVRE